MITVEDMGLLAQKHSEIVSKLCTDRGVPREKVFAHAGGAGKDLEACLNEYACPSWSFYGSATTNPAGFTEALALLEASGASWSRIAEWSVGGAADTAGWSAPSREGLAITGCRFLSIYDNVVGRGGFYRSVTPPATERI